MNQGLEFLARHSRLCLVVGLIAGLLFPAVANAARPWLPYLVGLLLFMTAFRVGWAQIKGEGAQISEALKLVVVLQLAMPLVAMGVFALFGVLNMPFVLAVVLMLSAPSVSGAANFTIMTGHDPAPAMRLLVVGTAVFPLTVIPVLLLMPGVGQGAEALLAGLRLIAVILCAVGAGFLARSLVLPHPSPVQLRRLDGLNALALAVLVVGLMSALGPLVRQSPVTFLWWVSGVALVNFGLQISSFFVLRRMGRPDAVPVSIVTGNRNIALFLIALSQETMDPLLIFVGCYQIPMYLTPLLLKRMHDRSS